MVEVERKDGILYLNGNSFADYIFQGCRIQKSAIILETRWLTFDPSVMDEHIGKKINEIVEHIFELRKQGKDEDAIDISDNFFQSFTPLMHIFVEQKNFSQVASMWEWLISKVKSIEESSEIKFGEGVHKGTAFYFLGFSRLMMENVDGAYLSFAEAANDDKILPTSVLNRHQKGLPPVVKILLLDLSKDNFAYIQVKQIRETIIGWEHDHSDISRSTPIFSSMQNAIDKNQMPRDSAIQLCHAFTKAFVLDSWRKGFGRPTLLTLSQLGDSILGFARTLEDFIRLSEKLSKNEKIFYYCNKTWFAPENWSAIPSYENNIATLVNDFINDKWRLSKDGRNLLFVLKIRNALAHRIPNDPKLFENYVEIIVAISSSFGFVCDKISTP